VARKDHRAVDLFDEGSDVFGVGDQAAVEHRRHQDGVTVIEQAQRHGRPAAGIGEGAVDEHDGGFVRHGFFFPVRRMNRDASSVAGGRGRPLIPPSRADATNV
jgi:hypothetical protein